MPVGLAHDPSVDLDRLDAGASSLTVSQGAGLGAAFDASRQMSGEALHWLGQQPLVAQGRLDPSEPILTQPGAPSPIISAEDANARYGIDGFKRFNAPLSEEDAAWQSVMAHRRLVDGALLERSNVNPLMSFGASLAGSLTDPVGLSVMLATGGTGDALLAGLGWKAAAEGGAAISTLGRLANAGGRTLATGALDNTPYVLASGALTHYAGDDYTLGDGLRDIAAGAILHTTVHAAVRGADLLTSRFRARDGQPANAFEPNPAPASGVPVDVDNLPAEARRGAFAMALDHATNDEPVDVGRHVRTELNPPSLERLNEPSAEPSIDSFRPLQDDRAVTTRGTEVPVRYGLVELGDLVTSHDDNLGLNPAYPAELQPRARERAGAQARNYQLEKELNPKLLLNDVGAGAGAPIVSPDGVVESGNGRTIALRRSAARGTPAYEKYVAELKAHGLPVEGMKQPVLVRMRTEPMQGGARAALAREMNADVTERMSAAEQAMSDGARIPDQSFDLVPDHLGPSTSREFTRDFIARVAPDQVNALTNADGSLSPEGVRRVKAAVLARAYGDQRLVGQIFEGEESATRKLGDALAEAAPAWAKMRAAAAKGSIPAELDLTEALTSANDLARYAKSENIPLGELIAERLGQKEMFGGDAISPQTEAFLRLFYRDEAFKKPLASAKIAQALKDYARQALEIEPGENLFGETAGDDTARAILKNVSEKFARGDAGDIDTVRPPGPTKGEDEPGPSILDVPKPGGDGDGAGPAVSPQGGGGVEDQGARGPTGEQLIAADPELKALAEDTQALAAENGLTAEFSEKSDPNTLAEAIRAAAVCLAGEVE